jgi:hypothetical protein
MKEHNILFILIQIDEAHSDLWPTGLVNQPEPQKNIYDRLHRAQHFVKTENVPLQVYVDDWNNEFAECYRAWPDKFYGINKNKQIIAKSEYGTDAKIMKDCIEVITEIISNK